MKKYFNINENIKLELIQENDACELFRLIDKNRIYLNKWLPWVESTKDISDSKNFIKFAITNFELQKSVQYKIMFNGKLCGLFGINDINKRNKSVSFGYWIGENFQNNGIVTNVCEVVKNYIIKNENIHRIEIRVDKNNLKSRLIPERLNFKLEGILKDADYIDNHYENVYIYSYLSL